MPFGLKNAPFAFQKVISSILGDLEFTKIFLDDILIFSKNENDHYKNLKIIFERSNENHCSINFDKSSFCQKEVKFLGHLIDEHGFHFDTSTLEKIENKLMPRTKKQLMSLIGLLQWF
ncbi:hypothetical protein DMUE_2575 [Dictyocoela muelleri]|nr:hypothetical protein DMUE_2575 [Dictyocoela muelleri]